MKQYLLQDPQEMRLLVVSAKGPASAMRKAEKLFHTVDLPADDSFDEEEVTVSRWQVLCRVTGNAHLDLVINPLAELASRFVQLQIKDEEAQRDLLAMHGRALLAEAEARTRTKQFRESHERGIVLRYQVMEILRGAILAAKSTPNIAELQLNTALGMLANPPAQPNGKTCERCKGCGNVANFVIGGADGGVHYHPCPLCNASHEPCQAPDCQQRAREAIAAWEYRLRHGATP